jgi:hypothetical protein
MVARTARNPCGTRSVSPRKAARLLGVFRFQMVDVSAVRLSERRAFDEKNFLGIELRAPRKIIRAGDHSFGEKWDAAQRCSTKQNGGLETHSFPTSLAATRRSFTFYVADPISSIHYFEQTRAKNFAHLLASWQSFSNRGSLRNGSQNGLN